MVEDTTHPIEYTYHQGFLFKQFMWVCKTAKVLTQTQEQQTNKQTSYLDYEQIIFHDIVYCFLRDVNLVKDDK